MESMPPSVLVMVYTRGPLSPLLFNLYMDDLSLELSGCCMGCMAGSTLVNVLMYADDLVIFSPSSAGFQ